MKKLFLPISKLENIFNQSEELKLPETCHYTLTQNVNIPYNLFAATLNNYEICILTLNFRDNSASFKQIVKNLGTPHSHKEKDSFLWDIKIPSEDKFANPIARSHKDQEFHFHTDCSYEENVPDYFALYVLHADQKSGGRNLIVDIKPVIKCLSDKSLKTLQNDPVVIKVPPEFFKGIDSIQASIIDKDNNIRYRREIIDFNHVTSKQLKAIGELESLVYSPTFCRGLTLSDDQILILSNKKFLHARTQIKDPQRHLQRIRFFKTPPSISFADNESKQELLSLKFAIKYNQLQTDKSSLIKKLNKDYTPVCFDEFNINPYPLLFSKELLREINNFHALLVEAIHKIVTNFFSDPQLQQVISLNDTALNLLHRLKDKPYQIGAIRPDFLFDKNYQLKICEINARFPLNAFLISQCIYTEMQQKFVDKFSYFDRKLIAPSEVLKQFFDCEQPVYIFFDKEKSFDIFLLQNIFKKILPNLPLKFLTPSEYSLKNQSEKHCFQAILNLHQDELFNLKSDLLNEITNKVYFNDLRTILIVHDKRLLSILSNQTIMSRYLSSEKCNRLATYIIPTYTVTDNILQNIKTNPKNWVLKKVSTGKGEGMYIGKETQSAEILTLLNEKKLDYIAQPFIEQPLFQLLNHSSTNSNSHPDHYQMLNLVGSLLSFNNNLLGPGILRGSNKTIINVAQGGTTIFMPIY
ncbi:hypothetical protein FQR65_LT05089 [Abscondita terminalis]|nr:hypothetical protein FQR65_LT05089 [Abscondita terminalis]